MRFTPEEIEAQDMYRVAFHEAAHFLAGIHFRLNPCGAFIIRKGTATVDASAYTGQTLYPTDTPAFQRCVIAWAGPIAEHVYDQRQAGDDEDDFKTFWGNFNEDESSPTDFAGMYCHFQRYRAAKLAWKIVEEQSKALEAVAKRLMETAQR